MNLTEFKAWFEGFTESMDGVPGPKAWERIKERVSTITSEPTKIQHIVHDYPWYRPPYWAYGLSGTHGVNHGLANLAQAQYQASQFQNDASRFAGEASAAPATVRDVFKDLGRQEAGNFIAD